MDDLHYCTMCTIILRTLKLENCCLDSHYYAQWIYYSACNEKKKQGKVVIFFVQNIKL